MAKSEDKVIKVETVKQASILNRAIKAVDQALPSVVAVPDITEEVLASQLQGENSEIDS